MFLRQAKPPAWLIPFYNYPAHLVRCDPGLREVTRSVREGMAATDPPLVPAGKVATQADSSFSKWNLERGARVICGVEKSS